MRSTNEVVTGGLKSLLGDDAKIIEGDFERELYCRDVGEVPFAQRLFNMMPRLIIQPKSVEALKKIVRFANEENMAVFPRGSASSGLGGVIPTVNGIVLDFSYLNQIDELNREEETIKVQAGVSWSAIEEVLKNENLSLRTYPSSFFSTVGGWIATGGYGIGSFQFGHLKNQIDSVEVLSPSGEIRSIHSGEKEFSYLFGTEGQFGILLTATLKLKKKPQKTLPQLIYFGSSEAAISFIKDMIQAEIKPYHVKYVDAAHLDAVNKILGEDLYWERDAVLVAFENDDDNQKFLTFSENRGIPADEYLSRYLWHERLFPLKGKSAKPTPLVCELVMPLETTVPFLDKVKGIAKRYGVEIQAEAHILGANEALLMVTYLSDVREPKAYLAHLSLIPFLIRLGIKFGGAPYGIGIWNTPFIHDKFDRKTLQIYRAYKSEVDPRNILNPNKFFSVRTKWANVPGILFHPFVFKALIRTLRFLTPVLLLPQTLSRRENEESLLEKTVYSCVKCGSCATHCPAYIVTHEDTVIPKNKLYLAKKLLEGEKVLKADSDKIFLCTHCGMCREVCQNDLDLLTAWTELEERLEVRFGKPKEVIQDFISATESSEDYWGWVYAPKVFY